MPGRGKSRKKPQHVTTSTSVDHGKPHSLSTDSRTLSVFKQAACKLVDRHDRHERLVKLSRDVTIESKRIIFILHAAVTKEKSRFMINAEARQRMEILITGQIQEIALELEQAAVHQHVRAVTAGLQEFVEARTLLSLMENRTIITLSQVREELVYKVISPDGEERQISTLLPHIDYMLGVADLTGELMRNAINSITSGDGRDCVFVCHILKHLYAGFVGLFGGGNILGSKLSTTRANVNKVEQAVYSLKIRGREAPVELWISQQRSAPAAATRPSGKSEVDEEVI